MGKTYKDGYSPRGNFKRKTNKRKRKKVRVSRSKRMSFESEETFDARDYLGKDRYVKDKD